MTTRTPILLATALLALAACGGREAADSTDSGDAEFAALQERGAEAMGVDQYTSSHVFEDLADGGRIVLQRDSVDAEGTATIRAHMSDIAGRFADGDFTIPGMVHDQEVPGTAVMSARRAMITYVADTLPRGAQVRIITTDPEALKAVHAFLAFQRMDHREMGHGEH
jgi:hypothetical protein